MFTYETWISILKIITLVAGVVGAIAVLLKGKIVGIQWKYMGAICTIVGILSYYFIEHCKEKQNEIFEKGSLLSRTVYKNDNSKFSSAFPEVEESGIPTEKILEVWMGGNVHGYNLDSLTDGELKILLVNQESPILIKFRDGLLLVSAKVYSFDKRLAGEIVDNQWKANPENVFRCCSDDYGVQIRDANDITCLVVDYVDKHTIKIQAVMRVDPVLIILDKDGMEFHSIPKSISEFRTHTKSVSRIFNDYCERY